MVKLDVYICDRCLKEFNVLETELPSRLYKYENEKVEQANESEREVHLCENCNASYAYWMEYVKESDKLFDEISRKEADEE